ncbi:unnamed protein product [Onchocerca flexuosa]|uniref:Uncharacterized protein n=1 Tax=Onchocerca flexuosa TaxID=387005 RepID=A0A183I1C8_9BILA|nr:unnamed protein product [Onchocerca flexuosa]
MERLEERRQDRAFTMVESDQTIKLGSVERRDCTFNSSKDLELRPLAPHLPDHGRELLANASGRIAEAFVSTVGGAGRDREGAGSRRLGCVSYDSTPQPEAPGTRVTCTSRSSLSDNVLLNLVKVIPHLVYSQLTYLRLTSIDLIGGIGRSNRETICIVATQPLFYNTGRHGKLLLCPTE